MEKAKIDVIIPTYHAGQEFGELLKKLMDQEYPVQKIIIMNTEERFWNTEWEAQCPVLEVHHLTKEEFDHGNTRKTAASFSNADILVFMTQDAMPADRRLIGSLAAAVLLDEKTGAAYARQLPKDDCRFLEKYTRSFNYPEESFVKTKKDIKRYGIKTYFCSNVCAAYDRKVYEEQGGFVDRAVFNEDMIYAGKMVQAGYGVAYVAEARVYHSHNYSCVQQFHRNFDLGVSQAEHPEIFQGVPSEGEGLKLVKKSLGYLCRTGRIWLIPQLVMQSGFKYMGYFLGKRYRKLPKKVILFCAMNKNYFRRNL